MRVAHRHWASGLRCRRGSRGPAGGGRARPARSRARARCRAHREVRRRPAAGRAPRSGTGRGTRATRRARPLRCGRRASRGSSSCPIRVRPRESGSASPGRPGAVRAVHRFARAGSARGISRCPPRAGPAILRPGSARATHRAPPARVWRRAARSRLRTAFRKLFRRRTGAPAARFAFPPRRTRGAGSAPAQRGARRPGCATPDRGIPTRPLPVVRRCPPQSIHSRAWSRTGPTDRARAPPGPRRRCARADRKRCGHAGSCAKTGSRHRDRAPRGPARGPLPGWRLRSA